MITVLDLAKEDTSLARKSVNEKSGPCPDSNCRCQNNGFNVKWNGESWVFMCRSCWDSEEFLSEKDRKRGWGGEIQYLMHYRGMKYSQALAALVTYGNLMLDEAVKRLSKMEPDQARALLIKLGAPESESGTSEVSHSRVQRVPRRQVQMTDPAQQKVIEKTLIECRELLRSDAGQEARNYLYGRGIPDEVIDEAYLGFSPKGGIPRLIIPSINNGRIVAIYRRDLRSDVSHDRRWTDVPGSTHDELYLADCLSRRDKLVVLVESAIDALSVIADCGIDFVNVVATSGITGCRNPDVLTRLARMPLVLVAFDADTDGDTAAKWWLKRLANARRLRPLLHDVNDMLIDRWDIREWIEQEIAKVNRQIVSSAGQDLKETIAQREYEQWLRESINLCTTCNEAGIETPALDEAASDGNMYCAEHHPDYRPLDDGEIPVYHLSPDEYMKRAIQDKLDEIEKANKAQERKIYDARQSKRDREYAKLRAVAAGVGSEKVDEVRSA